MSDIEKIIGNTIQEMRRGTLVLAVLSQLETSHYGYSLIEALSQQDLSIEQNTLYPLLRRLEKQGIVDSTWELEENRPRRYYRLNDHGRQVYKRLLEEWVCMQHIIDGLIKKGESSCC